MAKASGVLIVMWQRTVFIIPAVIENVALVAVGNLSHAGVSDKNGTDDPFKASRCAVLITGHLTRAYSPSLRTFGHRR
jgi:hypothetical protein